MRDLTRVYKNYKGKWVALDIDGTTVIASGGSAILAKNRAEKTGVSKFSLFKVPKELSPFIGSV